MNIYYTTQFKRDYKRIKKQKKDLDRLKSVIEKLALGEKLEPEYRDHRLSGNWKGHRFQKSYDKSFLSAIFSSI